MPATATRTKVINLRTDEARRDLIDRAAEALGKDRTEFMLDAATREAQSVLLERRVFFLVKAPFRRCNDSLAGPPAGPPRSPQPLPHHAPRARVRKAPARPATPP